MRREGLGQGNEGPGNFVRGGFCTVNDMARYPPDEVIRWQRCAHTLAIAWNGPDCDYNVLTR